jgi:hypothetical protein
VFVILQTKLKKERALARCTGDLFNGRGGVGYIRNNADMRRTSERTGESDPPMASNAIFMDVALLAFALSVVSRTTAR